MTTKPKSIAVALFFILIAAAVFSVPQIAVLDAILAPGMDPAAAVPVTDKIIEELVNSGKFTVIDRANVGQILQEKEFQLSSGIVRNEEIRQAGEYLGADFVVVANVSRVGSTYVISAKMIDVITGEIAAQASSEKQGKIDVLLEIARIVGKQISGQEIVVAEATTKVEEKIVEVVVESAPGESSLAIAQLQELIRTRTHMKRGGNIQMRPLVAVLSEQEKMMLYTGNRKDNAATGLLLNLLVTSLGSWIQGDVNGALIELSLALSGAVALSAGLEYDPFFDEYFLTGLGWAGLAVLITDVVYMCVRPFRFVRQWNQNLATILQVPYIALMDPEANTFSIVPADKGVNWRFGLNLVSVEY
jgi:TolB-like protein